MEKGRKRPKRRKISEGDRNEEMMKGNQAYLLSVCFFVWMTGGVKVPLLQ
jgi:hypothetical protein